MPVFSRRSKKNLASCDQRLQRILREAIKYVDFIVLDGHRPQEEQDLAFSLGRSNLRWPQSKHNTKPSRAVDVAPWFSSGQRIDWNDLAAFSRLAGYIERIADEHGVRLRWGGDWNQNWRTADERFIDAGHFELLDA